MLEVLAAKEASGASAENTGTTTVHEPTPHDDSQDSKQQKKNKKKKNKKKNKKKQQSVESAPAPKIATFVIHVSGPLPGTLYGYNYIMFTHVEDLSHLYAVPMRHSTCVEETVAILSGGLAKQGHTIRHITNQCAEELLSYDFLSEGSSYMSEVLDGNTFNRTWTREEEIVESMQDFIYSRTWNECTSLLLGYGSALLCAFHQQDIQE